MAETAGPARAGGEFGNKGELRPRHRHDHQLGDPFPDSDGKGGLASIPARHHQLALIIAIDQPDQIAEHDAVFVAEAGTRQHQRRQTGIVDVDGQPGRDQMGFTRLHGQRFRQTRAQVHPGRAGGGVVGQGEFPSQAGIEDFQFDGLVGHAVFGPMLLKKLRLRQS